MIKEAFNDFNELDKNRNARSNNIYREKDDEFNKIITEEIEENIYDLKIPYPESINNGFNFTVN